MKPHEMREKTIEEIRNDLAAAEENLRTLKFQLVTSQLDKTSVIRHARREIARLKTVIREHELGIRLLTGAPAATERPTSARKAPVEREAEEDTQ